MNFSLVELYSNRWRYSSGWGIQECLSWKCTSFCLPRQKGYLPKYWRPGVIHFLLLSSSSPFPPVPSLLFLPPPLPSLLSLSFSTCMHTSYLSHTLSHTHMYTPHTGTVHKAAWAGIWGSGGTTWAAGTWIRQTLQAGKQPFLQVAASLLSSLWCCHTV